MNIRIASAVMLLAACAQTPPGGSELPSFRVDPQWPKPLAEENGVRLVLGQVAGIAVNEKNGHVWLVHRPATLLPDEWNAKEGKPVTHRCCKSAAAVIELDRKSEGSNSRAQLGRPAHMVLSGEELFVADGYGNRRIVVFDAKTGAYKRHWGAYGTGTPTDDKLPPYDPSQPLSKSFGNPVHCVRVSNDGLVYVCDRVNNRIQVFSRDGQFRNEFRVEVQTLANGSVWDMVLSHDAAQKYMYVADVANGRIYIVRRSDGQVLGSFGRTGRMAGEFKWIHNIAIDRDGNLFTSEVGFGRRVQKFVRTGGAF